MPENSEALHNSRLCVESKLHEGDIFFFTVSLQLFDDLKTHKEVRSYHQMKRGDNHEAENSMSFGCDSVFSMTACEKTPDKSLVTQKHRQARGSAKEKPEDGSTLKDIIETTTDTYSFNYESDDKKLK